MKLPVIFFIFFFISLSCYSQDSTFYNSDRLEVFSLENATEYKVVTFLDEKGINAVERMYFKSGQMKSETFYSSFEKGKRTGKRSNWKESGNLYLENHFKNDKMEGPFIVYWENGREKRKDIYKKGKLIEGVVWDKEGNEIEYFPYEQLAEFPGGKKMMEKFLKENSKFPETSKKNKIAGRVEVKFSVEPTGEITDLSINSKDHLLSMEAYRLMELMPHWIPAKIDGKPVKCTFTLPIVFSNP